MPVWKYSQWQRANTVTLTVDGVEKGWAMESLHLYQHLYFATQLLMRHAPNISSSGARILYRLPRLLQCVLIDQLTSRHLKQLVHPQLADPQQVDSLHVHLDYVNSLSDIHHRRVRVQSKLPQSRDVHTACPLLFFSLVFRIGTPGRMQQ
jgi:hypothetical protein